MTLLLIHISLYTNIRLLCLLISVSACFGPQKQGCIGWSPHLSTAKQNHKELRLDDLALVLLELDGLFVHLHV